ncbi:hypothetical protein Clacol_002748 [Clathrus columnatus]|uniref:Ams2/SPT21 N-terminal domain-containing protein n=1 Tax=Clathrus columnatus TaxID=1419009 RepID=A0AAV5A9E5_9AGAM|nr:hypothetical protein Clacol_002748 [Clathrus columnatus]
MTRETPPSGKVDTANSETLSLPLRIIYTLNSSPQPLLARLRQKTLVTSLSETELSNETTRTPRYGRVFLRTCLATICASSPELLSDSSRDYSIYVVDPLESISGLSVGVGLLSWWLKNDRSSCNAGEEIDEYAVGRIVGDRGVESLEIVMSLKGTTPQSPEDHAKSLSLLASLNDGRTENNNLGGSIDSEKKTALGRCGGGSKTRIGRPPGASTNPEKKARRTAILEQKETLKKLQNLAKMQKGEPFDHTIITFADPNAPKVTEEDISRQRQIVDDLESRPVVPRQTSSLLTTKPLPSRVTSPAASLPNPQHIESKESGKHLQTPNGASGKQSGRSTHSQVNITPVSVSQLSNPTTPNSGTIADKQTIEALLSLLSSVLSKIDTPSAKTSVKGKANESSPKIDPTLVASLGQFLPLLVASSKFSLPGQNIMPSPIFHSSSIQPHPWNLHRNSSISGSQRLFQTADETFHISNTSSCQFTKHTPNYVNAKSDPPKVRDDAHPVPGGGWARGRNLVPRTPTSSSPSFSNRQSEQSCSTSGSSHPKRNKENKPPPETGRGTKRNSPAFVDKESDVSKRNAKKPRVEDKPGSDEEVKVLGLKRLTVGPTQDVSKVVCDIASSPVRSSRSRVRTSLAAVSEPDFQGPSVPLLAISDLPIPEPPRTPPPKNNATDSKSLFTPATPSNVTAHPSVIFTEASLFTPSPVRVNRSNKLTSGSLSHPAAVDSEPFTMKPGWDLPPSSPPPPTSPILSAADVRHQPTILTTSENTPQIMDKDGSRQVPSPSSPSGFFPSSTASSDFERLSEFSDTLEPAESSLPDDIELDIDELWKSLGPIIAQAQFTDNDTLNDTDCDISHVVTESQNGIDAAKLAEDLKALFGGCVV